MRVVELSSAPAPADACAAFLDLPGVALLESVGDFGALGRWSFLVADPFLRLTAKGRRVVWSDASGSRAEEGDPFDALRSALRGHGEVEMPVGVAPGEAPPFRGGAVGWLAYDLLHHLERVPAPRFDDLAVSDLRLGFHDRVVAWDHLRGRAWILSSGLPARAGAAREQRADERLRSTLARLDAAGAHPGVAAPARGSGDASAGDSPTAAVRPLRAPSHPVGGVPGLHSTFTRGEYLQAVARCREYVLAGDVFQVNLTQRLSLPSGDAPFGLYRRLRAANPAPFSAFLAGEDSSVLSVSPERFLAVRGDHVETRPIKGTSGRGYTPAHDLALGAELVASEKNRAENVMIVDLLRNDLSRVAVDGSVRVPELWRIERHPTVHHLVSTVTARLRPGLDVVDLLRAAFPGGSITGAPKVRAMEIIHELEPTRRGVYCGSIGWLGWDGAADLSIAIRTVTSKDGMAYVPVGGAVTADSDPEEEYRETLLKAAGILRAWSAPAAAELR